MYTYKLLYILLMVNFLIGKLASYVLATCAVFCRLYGILKMFPMPIFVLFSGFLLFSYSSCVCMLMSLVLSATEITWEYDFKELNDLR